MKILLFGASGTAGGAVLQACLDTPIVKEVRIIVRKPLGRTKTKLRQLVHTCHQANARREELLVEVGRPVGAHLREIVTGGKRGAAAFDHQHARRLVVRHDVERVQHLDHDVLRQRVPTFRPVQHEVRDDVVAIELDVAPGGRHGSEANGEMSAARRR